MMILDWGNSLHKFIYQFFRNTRCRNVHHLRKPFFDFVQVEADFFLS